MPHPKTLAAFLVVGNHYEDLKVVKEACLASIPPKSMFPYQYPVPQSDLPLSPRETLPTMYDLKSEDPEEPGLPDEFHDLQPQLLKLNILSATVFGISDI